MSTTVSLPHRDRTSRRTQMLAAASGLVAAVSVAVTLAVAGGETGESSPAQPSGGAATAQPQPATQYRNDATLGRGSAHEGGPSAADRFHHFR